MYIGSLIHPAGVFLLSEFSQRDDGQRRMSMKLRISNRRLGRLAMTNSAARQAGGRAGTFASRQTWQQ